MHGTTKPLKSETAARLPSQARTVPNRPTGLIRNLADGLCCEEVSFGFGRIFPRKSSGELHASILQRNRDGRRREKRYLRWHTEHTNRRLDLFSGSFSTVGPQHHPVDIPIGMRTKVLVFPSEPAEIRAESTSSD